MCSVNPKMCLRIALAISLVDAVAGERVRVDDMHAVLINATRHGDRLEPVSLDANQQGNTYDFHTSSQADQLMQQLNAQAEWTAFLSELNAALKSDDQILQNTRGKNLAAQFNSDAHSKGKLQEWKVTFYTRFVIHEGGEKGGSHRLVIEPESSNRFYEKHVGRSGEWDRACCCQFQDKPYCKYSWFRSGRCCKFKYGDISRYGCSLSWLPKSTEKVADTGTAGGCYDGPAPPSFPGWKFAEVVE